MGELLGRTPRVCRRKQMDPTNGKHTSVHTKTPEFKENPANKHVEPAPATAGGSPSTQRPLIGADLPSSRSVLQLESK